MSAVGESDIGDQMQFASNHPGIVQYCLADGSVRVLRPNMDDSTFQALSGWHDGVAINWSLVY